MANKATLRPPFNPEEARYYGKKGGQASAESRRKKGTVRERLKNTLYKPVTDKKQLDLIKKAGIPIAENHTPDYLDFIVASTVMREIKTSRFGDLETLAALLGENSQDEQKQNGMLADLIDGLKDDSEDGNED